jgi:hypothetical protein
MVRNNKKIGVSTRNDKIVTSNNKGIKKVHWKHHEEC